MAGLKRNYFVAEFLVKAYIEVALAVYFKRELGLVPEIVRIFHACYRKQLWVFYLAYPHEALSYLVFFHL